MGDSPDQCLVEKTIEKAIEVKFLDVNGDALESTAAECEQLYDDCEQMCLTFGDSPDEDFQKEVRSCTNPVVRIL